MKLKTILCDDEALGRDRLRDLLASEPDLQIVAECSDGLGAVEAVRQHGPDLLFLDVQMPELDGFGVLAALGSDAPPAVIFVTAHDRFALQAFEVHAVDYLLKPFDRERLRNAVARVRQRFAARPAAGGLDPQIGELLASLNREKTLPGRLAIKVEGRVRLLRVAEVDWVESADNYVAVHVGKETLLHRETLAAFEARLPAAQFVRISRTTIVNLERVKELEPLFHGEYAVILRDGTKLTLSRTHRDKLGLFGVGN